MPTHEPIADASVFIAGLEDPDWLAWDITIDHGAYAFAEVNPGYYSLTLIWDQSDRLQDELDDIIDITCIGGSKLEKSAIRLPRKRRDL